MYCLRHTAISEMIADGVDSFVVAKLTGTSTAMTNTMVIYAMTRHEPGSMPSRCCNSIFCLYPTLVVGARQHRWIYNTALGNAKEIKMTRAGGGE
jgi:hypothetical protein